MNRKAAHNLHFGIGIHHMLKTILTWGALAFFGSSASGVPNNELQITLIAPDQATQMVAGEWWKVFLKGNIDPDSSRRLALELSRNQVRHGVAFLDSPGGSLEAGMEIGRLLRKHGLSTSVGRQDGTWNIPGECFSACVFAFVGGYFRYLNAEDMVGVHRFSKNTPAKQNDLDVGQIVSARITSYLTEMGIDTKLFEIMTQIPSNKIYVLPLPEARELRIANNGFQPPVWSIEAVNEGLYLRGVQETWHGLGKVIFACLNNAIIFQPYMNGGSNSDTIVQLTVKHSLRLDDNFFDIGRPAVPLTSNKDFVSATFRLSQALVERIKTARSVGYAAHPNNPDLFWGFMVDIETNHQKIDGFFAQCLRDQQE